MNSRNSSFTSFNVVHTSVYLFVCLSVRVKHGRDYHSMYVSRLHVQFPFRTNCATVIFQSFFSFNRLSWIFFFLARTIVNWRCVSVTKSKKKEKNGLLTKYCKVSLCLNAVFMKFAYDSHTFPQFMIVIWLLDTVIQYYLKSWNLSKFQINYRLNELTCLYKWCGFFFSKAKLKFDTFERCKKKLSPSKMNNHQNTSP